MSIWKNLANNQSTGRLRMMKKLFLVFTFTLLSGCSFMEKENPVVIPPSIESFTIQSGDTGLILKSTADDSFENILSTHPILDAEIKDGILTYTEDIDSVPMTRAVNLNAFLQFLKK